MISLLCPSRARAPRFRAMLDSAIATAEDPRSFHVALLVDADDPQLAAYQAIEHAFCDWVELRIQPERRPVPAILNAAALEAPGEILFTVADDLVFKTRGWDRMLRQAFAAVPDRILVVWTNDGLDRDKAQHWACSRRVVELLGYFCWPDFEHFYGDEMIERIARKAGRGRYLRELVTQHRHFKHRDAENKPLAERDETYAAKRVRDDKGRSVTDRDKVRMDALLGEVDAAAARLQGAFGT
jgi:hypothetical protein